MTEPELLAKLTETYQRGAHEEALAAAERVLGEDPDHIGALHVKAWALHRTGQAASALALIAEVVARQPDYALALDDFAGMLAGQGRIEQAIELYRRAAALCPENPYTYNRLGLSLVAAGRFDEAVSAYGRAIALKADFAAAHMNRASVQLLRGRWREGFEEYDWRLRLGDFPIPEVDLGKPVWRGEDIAGRTLLLRAEQGFGDAIQFIRFARVVAARGARVVLQCRNTLRPLLATAPGVAATCARDTPAFDLHCPLLSLPRILGTMPETVPDDAPYLRAPPARAAAWRRRLEPYRAPRIGLVWRSGLVKPDKYPEQNRTKLDKSLRLAALAPLVGRSGASWLSFQLDASPQERDALRRLGVPDFTAELTDFAETAAAVAALDLVVTIDTALAHLAGALAKPVWTLLPDPPDWRWLLDRDDTPWYPTMRLFRPGRRGDPSACIDAVAEALAVMTRDTVRRS